jgi:hypothetical protein
MSLDCVCVNVIVARKPNPVVVERGCVRMRQSDSGESYTKYGN